MTPRQVELVQETFNRVRPAARETAAAFYARLFEIEPSLRSLFRSSMEEQGQKLITTLALAVAGLQKLDELIPALQMLGRRHVAYGVEDEHYALVGRALLDTLESGLGDAFTPETREAWSHAYDLMAQVMQQAAAPKAG